MNATEQTFLHRLGDLRDEQVRLTRELVAIPTVNPYSGDDSAGIETAGQAWMAARLAELGAQVRHIPVPPDVYERGDTVGPPDRCWDGRDNVVGEWTFGDGTGHSVILNCHMDTVGTAGMAFDAFDPVVEDGRLRGRGSSDSKGNLVMGLTAVRALLADAAGLNGRVIFESVVDEECNGAGAGTLACCLAGVTADIALCLDGDSSRVVNGCNGIATARVIARGQAGHSSTGASVNAIDKGIAVKRAVDAFAADHRQTYPRCDINVGIFRSGTLPAIVPGEAELQINLSYDIADARAAAAAGERWGGVLFRRRFEAALAALPETDPWFADMPADVFWVKDMYPYEADATLPLAATAIGAAAAVYGARPRVEPMKAWFDGAHLARHLAVPTLGMGGGTPGTAHTPTEHVVLPDLFRRTKAVALALHRLLHE